MGYGWEECDGVRLDRRLGPQSLIYAVAFPCPNARLTLVC